MRSVRRVSPRVYFDVALAVGLAAMGTVEFLVGGSSEFRFSHGALAIAVNIALTLPLVMRRRAPVITALVMGVVLVVQVLVQAGAPFGSVFAYLVIGYTVTAYCARLEVGGLLVLMLAAAVSPHLIEGGSKVDIGSVIFTYVPLLVCAAAGVSQRRRVARTRALELDVAGAAARAAEMAASAVSEERARIARELHDVVAHKMSVIVLQAGGALRVLDRDPDKVREVLTNIETQGREALTEMRRVLEVMRVHGVDGPELLPQPGLQDLPALVADVSQAGVPVKLSVAGEVRALPPGLDLSAYRIVQEALTNVLKHATGAAADVNVHYGDGKVELLIQNQPGAAAKTALRQTGGGHGLVGMRERVSLFGGELHAGPHDGGYRVQALLPVEMVS
ncbi:MAG: sensor histidine kinase [Candidatus Dormibacteraeota bacterium]|nr:sensor histidine kinase [Candidatus Dormibacteraeota bacterium]